MKISQTLSLAPVLCAVFALPVGYVSAAGGGRGAAPIGAVATPMGAVGGGAAAGRVGGGPPAGLVGGGAPGSSSGATGIPSTGTRVGPGNPAAGFENAPGGIIGTGIGEPPKSDPGGVSPAVTVQTGQTGQTEPAYDAPKAVQGIAEAPPVSTVGLAKPDVDGVSTRYVKPQPCGVAAHETDGFTTCIGLPIPGHLTK
jgi:hypothetical protein